MSVRTVLVLLFAVLLLAFAAWRQSARETETAEAADVALFAGFGAEDVGAIRVEHVERDWYMRLERGANGLWRMTDPVEVEAEQALVEFLLSSALARRGTPVLAAESAPEAIGLAPPRIVLELEVGSGAGARRERVELGALDFDGQRIYARIVRDGAERIVRTMRDLDTTLARTVEDFKSKKPVVIDPRSVVEVHRRGRAQVYGEDAPRDLAFDALVEDGAWRATAPFRAALDPVAIGLWLQACSGLEADIYLDHGTVPLVNLGLDPPEITTTFGWVGAVSTTLELGRTNHDPLQLWNARVVGRPAVWTVKHPGHEVLLLPVTDLLDHRLVRYARAAITALEWRDRERAVRVEREGRFWNLAAKPVGDAGWQPLGRAEPARVEELLARLERFELAGFRPERTIASAEETGAFAIETEGGQQGGVFGGIEENPAGGRAILFQRTGDSIAALADPVLHELVETRAESLLSLDVSLLTELDQASLVLTGLDRRRAFVRSPRGRWTPEGLDVEARELHAVLDPLFFLRASRHLGSAATLPPLVDPITVEFTGVAGGVTRFVIGRGAPGGGSGGAPGGAAGGGAGGASEVEFETRRSVLKDAELHARLAEILRAS